MGHRTPRVGHLDEIYEHLNYDGAKTTYIGAAVPEVRSQLLVLNGVAKTYAMPGWRVGWMIAPWTWPRPHPNCRAT